MLLFTGYLNYTNNLSNFASYQPQANVRPQNLCSPNNLRGRRGRDRMVVGLTTTYAISAYHD